jgi:hypothetical protein
VAADSANAADMGVTLCSLGFLVSGPAGVNE